MPSRRPQVSILGSAEPVTTAYALAGEVGTLLASMRITLISGGGSPATRAAAAAAHEAGGLVVGITTDDNLQADTPACSVLIPCAMGDARNLLMAVAADACIVIGGRAGTLSEVCLAWLHHRPLLPLVGCGGWSDRLATDPPDERANSPITPWATIDQLRDILATLTPDAATPA